MTLAQKPPILHISDPEPVEIVNASSQVPVLLLCEHAGRAMPRSLKALGLPEDVIDSHRGWDIGALDVARLVAAELGAPLVIQNYSRLVIDSNRPPESAHAFPTRVDGVDIPGNVGITSGQKRQRAAEIFAPLDAALTKMMRRLKPRGCFSIHSYTPVLEGKSRPWHAGFLSRRDLKTAHAMMRAVAALQADLIVAVNQPYQIDDETDWFIPRHAEPSGAAHALIEIRNDLVADAGGVALWAGLIASAITTVIEETAA